MGDEGENMERGAMADVGDTMDEADEQSIQENKTLDKVSLALNVRRNKTRHCTVVYSFTHSELYNYYYYIYHESNSQHHYCFIFNFIYIIIFKCKWTNRYIIAQLH